MARKKSTRLMILLAIIGALVLLIAQLSAAFATPAFPPVLVSTDSAGTVDGVDFGPEDILLYTDWGGPGDWSLYFDGSDYELEEGKHDIEAFYAPESYDDDREIYLSFYQNKVMVDGLGQVMGQDIIKFTETISPSASYTYTRYFDGSDVGLTTVSEKIDGLDINTYLGNGCAAYLYISTLGEYSIPAANSGTGSRLRGDGSDILFFCATNLGADTAGFWYPFFDGQEEGMPKNYIDSISSILFIVDDEFFFTTPGAFALDSAFGGHSEVYEFDGDFSGPVFSAPDEGLTEQVDGLQVWDEVVCC